MRRHAHLVLGPSLFPPLYTFDIHHPHAWHVAHVSQPQHAQAFASPAKLAEMVAKVNEAMAGPLPASISKMKAYLANPSTHAILFKPVKSNIAEAHGQVGGWAGGRHDAGCFEKSLLQVREGWGGAAGGWADGLMRLLWGSLR